jgi:hypothetical protein
VSRMETIDIECPQCGHRQEMTRWHSVNASLSPQAKAVLLSGKLHVFRCLKCGVQARLDVEVMYHDMERRFCIMYYPPASLDNERFFDLFSADASLNLRTLPDIPEAEHIRRPHIVFDLDEMRRYILFRDGLAQRHGGQTQLTDGGGIENL